MNFCPTAADYFLERCRLHKLGTAWGIDSTVRAQEMKLEAARFERNLIGESQFWPEVPECATRRPKIAMLRLAPSV